MSEHIPSMDTNMNSAESLSPAFFFDASEPNTGENMLA